MPVILEIACPFFWPTVYLILNRSVFCQSAPKIFGRASNFFGCTMAFHNRVRLDARKLFDLLATMTIGASCWFIGVNFGLFDALACVILAHGLLNLLLLCCCVGISGVFAIGRTSLELRRAVAARIAAEAVAEQLARQDPLTGLGNRRFFNERATEMLHAHRSSGQLSIMLIDLDRFKAVNDMFGHAAGDAVLCAVAERLRQLAPDGSLVARLGGDEFVVLSLGIASMIEIGGLAQKMIDAIQKPTPWGQGSVEVDATIGIAFAEEAAVEPEVLLHAADVAMYEGKRCGRGVWRIFGAESDEALKTRERFKSELPAAIIAGEICPFMNQ